MLWLFVLHIFLRSTMASVMDYNDAKCGLAIGDHIVGGEFAPVGRYPWVSRLGYYIGIPNQYGFLCDGSLVNKNFVITAAHCSGDNERLLMVARFGEKDSTCAVFPCPDTSVQEVKVKETLVHSDYTMENAFSDVAIIKLETPVEYTAFVLPICIKKSPPEPVGATAIVVGWGLESSETLQRPIALKQLHLKVLPSRDCEMWFGEDLSSPNYICAGAKPNEDTCGGDSGGPLMVDERLDQYKRTYLVGIVSFGTGECAIGAPSVFTSVSHHFSWILENIKT